jgi:PKD repeat protein
MKNILSVFFTGILLAVSVGSVSASGLPQANFIVSPAVGRVSSEFTLDARQSRNSAGNLGGVEIRYQLSSGGNWSKWTRQTVQKFTPMDTGTMKVTVQVRDVQTGQVQTTFRSIKVLSSWSRRAWISVQDSTAEVGQPVDFQLQLSLQSFDNPDDVEIRWDFDSDGNWDTKFSRQKLVTHVFDTASTVSPTAEVKFFDDEILTVKGIEPRRESLSRYIVPKTFWKKLKIVSPTIIAPVVDVRPGRVGFDENTTFVFDSSSARVPRGGWIEWSFDGQQWLRFPGKKTATHQFTSPGKHEVRTRVCLGYSNPRCEETTTEIEVKRDPTDYRVEISLLNRTNSRAMTIRNAEQYVMVEVGDRIRFMAQLRQFSGAGQRYLYRWDFNNDGVWDTNFSTQSFSEHVYDKGGEFTARVQVQNEDSVVADSSRRIFVDINEKPVAEIGMSPEAMYTGERIRFFPKFPIGRTYDWARTQVRFDLDGDGVWESDFRGIGGQDWIYSVPGAVTVRMEIRDPGKNVTTVNKTIEILPFPDVAARVIVSQRSGAVGSQFQFDASESTGRGLRFIWNFDAQNVVSGADISFANFGTGSRSARTSHVWNTPGEKWISLTVIDDRGTGDQIVFPVEVE